MKSSESKTLEQVLFDRMGVSIEDALATGVDTLDDHAARSVARGADLNERLSSLLPLLERFTEPETVAALHQFLDALPRLAELARAVSAWPDVVATAVDVLDEFQQKHADRGVDLEQAMVNGLEVALWLGSKVDSEHLKRIGDLLGSDILNPHALNVIDNAARSLTSAQKNRCDSQIDEKIGLFGMLRALRNPRIQRSLAFAARFGECFGNNLENEADN